MFIRLFEWVARLFPKSWKAEIKTILRAIVLDVIQNPAARTPKPVTKAGTLLEFYFQKMDQLDPDTGWLATMKELRKLRDILKEQHPSQILRADPSLEQQKVSIIIPVYSNHRHLAILLNHLSQHTVNSCSEFEVIIVNDLPSESLPPDLIEATYPFPVTVIHNQWNQGYAASNNIGSKHATGEHLLFLNSDIVPLSDSWLSKMITSLERDPQMGIVGAKTLYSGSNRIEHFGMYAILDPQLHLWNNAHYFHSMENGLFEETDVDRECDMVTGAALMIRSSLFKEIGGFDETFLIGGFEDSDLCRKTHDQSYRVQVCSGAVLSHHKSVSLQTSARYNNKIARCNLLYFNHLWKRTLDRMKRTDLHPFSVSRSRMRVLFVAHGCPPEFTGGTELYNLNLARAVSHSADCEAVILVRGVEGGAESKEGDIVYQGLTDDVPLFRCLRQKTAMINEHPRTELEFEIFLNSIRPDVVHFNHTENLSTNFIQIAKRCISGPIVYTLHEYLPICANYGLMVHSNQALCDRAEVHKCAQCVQTQHNVVLAREKLYRQNFANVDLFIAPSEFLRQRYIAWGIKSESIRHISHGIPQAHPPIAKTKSATLSFGYLGQLVPHKGISTLLDAVDSLRSQKTNFHVHVHGHFPPLKEFEEFRQTIERRMRDLADRVTFHGYYSHDDVYKILAGLDVLIVPSTWWENSPLTIQEAFVAGVPVLTSNIGGMRELVSDGQEGFLFEVKNATDLAKKMRQLIEQPQLASNVRQNLSAIEIKSMQQHATELIEIYKGLIVNSASAVLPA